MKLSVLPVLVVLSACLIVGTAVAEQEKSVNDGVYSDAQATRGQAAFERNCTNCHDTLRFTGAGFVQSWSGKPLAELYDVLRTTMPEDNPGSLKPQQYADLLSFFLQLNGYTAGEIELIGTDAAMKAVRMEAPKSSAQK